MSVNELHNLESDAGLIAREAMIRGGDGLLDKAMSAMGVAYRHFGRIESGSIPLSPIIRKEILESLMRGREVVEAVAAVKE